MSEEGGGVMPPEADGDREFRALNERARMLAERALFHGDHAAGRELQVLFSPLISRMRRSVREAHRDDLASELTAATMRALKQAVLKRKDLPLAYALTAIRNEYIRQRARMLRHDDVYRPMPDGFDVPGTAVDHEAAFHADAVVIKIDEFRREARNGRSKVDALLAEVVAVCYLNEASFAEACALLSLTEPERKTLRERLSRVKGDPNSQLNHLGDQIRRIIGGLFDDETLPRPADDSSSTRGQINDRRTRRKDG